MPKLVLASTSKYRRALLDRLGLSYTTAAPRVDEDGAKAESLEALALQLAVAKAESCAGGHPDAYVLGSDQLVDLTARSWASPARWRRPRSSCASSRAAATG